MKTLRNHIINGANARAEWQQFSTLLASKPTLDESKDILPFFKQRNDLSLLVCNYFPAIIEPDCVAHEFSIEGDFTADLIVGDTKSFNYLLVEFENATSESIFRIKGKKATPEWAPRLEAAYSQLIDWLWKLEDMRSTSSFQTRFGDRRAVFNGLIVTGKDVVMKQQEQDRLKWRMDRTRIDSQAVSVVTFDQLRDSMDGWLKKFYRV